MQSQRRRRATRTAAPARRASSALPWILKPPTPSVLRVCFLSSACCSTPPLIPRNKQLRHRCCVHRYFKPNDSAYLIAVHSCAATPPPPCGAFRQVPCIDDEGNEFCTVEHTLSSAARSGPNGAGLCVPCGFSGRPTCPSAPPGTTDAVLWWRHQVLLLFCLGCLVVCHRCLHQLSYSIVYRCLHSLYLPPLGSRAARPFPHCRPAHAGEPPCDVGWLPDATGLPVCRFCGANCDPACNEAGGSCPEGLVCSTDDPAAADAECVGACPPPACCWPSTFVAPALAASLAECP